MSIRTYAPPVTPTPDTVEAAQRVLAALEQPGAHVAVVGSGDDVELNKQLHDVLRQLLADLADNRAIALLPLDQELTPNQAADILNVSRGLVLRRIESGELPARMVGSHHRIRLDDLLAYKRAADQRHEAAMQELADLGQELGLD